MSRLNRKEILEGIGVFSIVASLLFVGLQVNQSQRAGMSTEYISYMELLENLRFGIAEHGEVWSKACLGEELTAGEKVVAGQLFKTYVEFVSVTALTSEVGVARDWPEFLINRYAANVNRYPGFAQLVAEHRVWTAEGEKALEDPRILATSERILSRVAELREIEPHPDYDVMWCGM